MSILVLGFCSLASIDNSSAQILSTDNAVIPKELTQEEAAKYPPPAGKYLEAQPLPTSSGGFYKSPYSNKVYDLRKVNKHALILDENAKKVFTKP